MKGSYGTMTVPVGGEERPLRATRIVATVGPWAEDRVRLGRLLEAGVNVVRLNGAHVKPGEILRRVATVRSLEPELNRPVGVLLDLGGPKIRVAALAEGAEWPEGAEVEIVPGAGAGAGPRIFVTYPTLLDDVHPGETVLIDDGKLRLSVTGRRKGALVCRVVVGGKVRSGAGVNFPHSTLSAPPLTPKDRRDLKEGLEAGVDFVGLSFVRSAKHVALLRKLIDVAPPLKRPWIVAKIERPEAILYLEEIARAADVLMVARGDLGVEMGLAAVPALQRRILATGRRLSVPVIVATQMLESMIESPVPTRAEVSDVAGAVSDGADAVMLSGETATGKHPLEAVRAMDEIVRVAEEAPREGGVPQARETRNIDSVVAAIAADAARLSDAKALVVYTQSGRTARLLSKSAGVATIVALTPDEEVRRKLTVLRDVVSFRIPVQTTVESMLAAGEEALSRVPRLAGATVVEVSGEAAAQGATNTVRIRRLPPPAVSAPRSRSRRRAKEGGEA